MNLKDLIDGGVLSPLSASLTNATYATSDARNQSNDATVATVSVLRGEVLESFSENLLLTDLEEISIRAWLKQIGENDFHLIERMIHYCRSDRTSRDFFLANSMPKTIRLDNQETS